VTLAFVFASLPTGICSEFRGICARLSLQFPMEDCPVCSGSGLLLNENCPLCGGCSQEEISPSSQDVGEKTHGRQNSPPHKVLHSHGLALVLDIDGTLLSESAPDDYNFGYPRYLRPHLFEFLDFAFDNFHAVGIWTAASESWMRKFVDVIGPRPWAFMWSGARVTLTADRSSSDFYATPIKLKRLSKLWRNKSLRSMGYTPQSTLIIDNTPSVCRCNFGNAVYIRTFEGTNTNSADDWLLVLVSYLKQLQILKAAGNSMRSIEKRSWYMQTG